MSSRVTRSRATSENPQTTVKDFFKTTRKPRTRGEKKVIIEGNPNSFSSSVEFKPEVIQEEKNGSAINNFEVASMFERKSIRARTRTPSRQIELSAPDVTGTPPKKCKDAVRQEELPVLTDEAHEIVLENPTVEKSALDLLMESSGPVKKKTGIRTVADLQSRLAAKGAAKSIHAQNLKNKVKLVDEHAEMLKSPKKKLIEIVSPTKSKASRALFSPTKSVPDYIVPGFNVTKSAEKVREEQEDAYEEEGKRMTAEYLKKSRLIDEVKASIDQRVPLPSSYEHLADSFRLIDTIIGTFLGLNRNCVATELYKNIKKTSGKDFSDEHLSQILSVYPEAYHVEMREQSRAFNQGGKYELELRPNLVEDLQGYVHERMSIEEEEEMPLVRPSKQLSPMKSPRKKVQPLPRKPILEGRTRLDAARQRDRAHVFRYKLTGIVLKQHEEFLESQGLLNLQGAKRLHPLFQPNKHCKDLPKIELPKPPIQKSSVHIGMKEALEKMQPEQVLLPSSMQRVMNDLKSPQKETTGASGAVPISPKKFSEMQEKQKSTGGMSLLERIRAKEAVKKAAESCVDKDLQKRKQRLSLLNERYIRIVCNRYTTKKSRTMQMETVAEFLQFSSSTPSTIPDIIEHLRLLCEVAPVYVAEELRLGKKYLHLKENNMEAIVEIVVEELGKTEEKINLQRNTQIAQMSHAPRPKAARSLKFH